MASEKPPTSNEAFEPQDQSIKSRKFQLFETRAPEGTVVKPFTEYVKNTPPAPLSPAMKGVVWGVGALVVILLLAALFAGRAPKPKKRQTALDPGFTINRVFMRNS